MKLHLSDRDKKLGGVCGGIAEYFEIDPTLVRVIWAVCTLFAGFALLAYIICAIIFPKKSEI